MYIFWNSSLNTLKNPDVPAYLFVPMSGYGDTILVICNDKLSILQPPNRWRGLMRPNYFENATLKFELTSRLNSSFMVSWNRCSSI